MDTQDQKFALRTVYISSIFSTIGVFIAVVAMDKGVVTGTQFTQVYFLMAVLSYILMNYFKIEEHKMGFYLIAMVVAPITILSIIAIYGFYFRLKKSGSPDVRP